MIIKTEEDARRLSQIDARSPGGSLRRHDSVMSNLPPYSAVPTITVPQPSLGAITESEQDQTALGQLSSPQPTHSPVPPPTPPRTLSYLSANHSPGLSTHRSQSSLNSATPPIHPNHVAVNSVSDLRHNSDIRGHYTVDPTLPLSPHFVPGRRRRNLELETRNGCIDIHVTVREGTPSDRTSVAQSERTRTTISMLSVNGAVTVRLRTEEDAVRAPIWVSAKSQNGPVSMFLPRSFRGLIDIFSRNGVVSLSEDVQARSTTITEIPKSLMNWTSRHQFFLNASMSPVQEAEAAVFADDRPWSGDEAQIEAINGGVRIAFFDEDGTMTTSLAAKTLLNALLTRMLSIVMRPGGAAALDRRALRR